MDIVICQYCNSEVSLAEIEKEGGACPECGAMVSGSLLFNGNDEEFDEEMDDFGGGAADDDEPDFGSDDEEFDE